MKHTLFLLALFSLITGSIAVKTKPIDKIGSFQWLIGSWKMQTKRGVITETWNTGNDSTLHGESSMTRSTGETMLLEKIQLAFRGNEYFYIPVAQGQNDNKPVQFKITSHSATGFVAENPEHDFPKRITYQLVNRDSIHAFIDGGPSLPDKKSDFYYSRIKN